MKRHMVLPAEVFQMRAETGLSQAAAAKFVGESCTRSTWSSWETGVRNMPLLKAAEFKRNTQKLRKSLSANAEIQRRTK